MPNGTPTEEREWSEWRGEITQMLRESQAWMKRHEEMEFAYHTRVEAHMAETRTFIGESAQQRRHLDQRMAMLETDVKRIDRDMEQIKARLIVGGVFFGTVILPIAGWALFQIIDHFKGVTP